jgi:hypothetical protein
MMRWLREQFIQLDTMQTLQHQPPQFRQQIQYQQRQQEMLRIFPTARFPNYLNRMPTTLSYEKMLFRNMTRNLENMNFNAVFTDAVYNPPLVPRGVIHGGGAMGAGIGISGDFCIVRAIERRRHRRNAEQLDRIGIDRLPTRLNIIEIYEIIERANQVFRETKSEEVYR